MEPEAKRSLGCFLSIVFIFLIFVMKNFPSSIVGKYENINYQNRMRLISSEILGVGSSDKLTIYEDGTLFSEGGGYGTYELKGSFLFPELNISFRRSGAHCSVKRFFGKIELVFDQDHGYKYKRFSKKTRFSVD